MATMNKQPVDTRREDEKYTLAAGEFGKALYMELGWYPDMYYINDIPTQKAGIDIIMDTAQGPIYIDEKMAIKHRDKNLATYSLELSSQNNKGGQGWLTSQESKTTHYAFTWLRADTALNVVHSWQTALVKKDAIKEMLRADNIHTDSIKDEFLGYIDLYKQHKDLAQAKDYLYNYAKWHQMGIKEYFRIQQEFEEKFNRKFDTTFFERPIDKIKYEYQRLWDEMERTCPTLNKVHVREKTGYDGNPHSYEWRIGDYKLVHSVHLKERPINIVVPKEKLIKLADFVIDREGEFNVQSEIQRIRNKPRLVFPNMSPNQIKQIEREDRVPGELALASAKYTHKTGKMRNAKDGDFIYIGNNPRNVHARVATYSQELDKWLVTHPDFPIKNNPKFIDIRTYIRDELLNGRVPVIFKTTDILHNTINPDRLKNPEHGDVTYLSGAATGGQRIMLTYNKFIDAYSLSSNDIISPKDLPKFMGRDVIDDKILQLEKAVGERIIYGLRNALHAADLKYKNASATDIEKYLPAVLKAVQSSSWQSNRYSDIEAAMQATTPKERSELFKILNNPRLVTDLAQEIAKMSRENKYLPESISSVIYKPSRQKEYERLDMEENLRRTSAQAYKTTPTKLEELAMTKVLGVQTFTYKTYTGQRVPCVSWSPDTIEKTASIIKEQLKPQEPVVIAGKTPLWVASAIAAQIDVPVYIKNNNYCVPVQTIPSIPTLWQIEQGLETTRVTSQGLDFQIQKGVDAVTIHISPSVTDKQYYFSEINMRKLNMPKVEEPPANIYIKIHKEGTREVPPAVVASLAKTYMDMGCDVYMYTGHRKAYSCVNKENLHMEPKRETDFAYDMYVGSNIPQHTPALAHTPEPECQEKEFAHSR